MEVPEYKPHESPLLEIRAALRRLVVATVILFVVLAGLGVFVWVSSAVQRTEIRRVAVQSVSALCTLRRDLEARIKASRQFLIDHPHGIQGISPLDIQRSIDAQQHTIDALAILDCPPLKEAP